MFTCGFLLAWQSFNLRLWNCAPDHTDVLGIFNYLQHIIWSKYSPSSTFWVSASLRCSFHHDRVTDLLLINLMFLQLFIFRLFLSFSAFLLPPSQLFMTCCCHQIQDETIFFTKCLTSNIWCVSCAELWIKFGFIPTLHGVSTFLNWACTR